MNGYKGFDKDLKCRDFTYKIGESYEEEKADLCNKGFHFCENPLDVFGYYPPADSRYCEIEADDISEQTSEDSKRCSKKISINVEIGLKGIIDAGLKFVLEKIDWTNNKESNTGDQSAATNTGYRSAATNTGDQSAAIAKGKESIAIATGIESKAKGILGCWIVLAEWEESDDGYHIIDVKSAKVDNENIKEDVFYTLKDGNFIEVS